MARINLLPWREALRKELQQQFFITVAFFIVIVIAVWGAVHVLNSLRIEHQQSRIQFLQNHITNVEKKIEEIKLLEKDKARLNSRIAAIEQLQSNRPLIVRLFDELVTSLPEGVSVVSVKQGGAAITISGIAESNARVSSFMRKLDGSEWLGEPKLDVIEAKNENEQRISNFTMRFKQTTPNKSKEDEEDEEA